MKWNKATLKSVIALSRTRPEQKHRVTGEKKYIGAVPDSDPDSYTNTMFDRWKDASRYPFPSDQAAAAVILSFPNTRNIDYAVIEAKP